MVSNNSKISVALCTYNGAKYLEEQLWSISNQSITPVELVVCDDRSSDDTVIILKKFKSAANFLVRIYENSNQIGVLKNFTKAISLCKTDYIALCDQDDIWLPQKLFLSCEAIKKAESYYGKDIPILVHSDLKVANSKGEIIAASFMQQNKIPQQKKEPLKTLLVQNYITGCSVLINRPLVEEALPIPERALMHDWWLALVAASVGEISYVPEPTVLYRQHRSNVIGSKRFFSISNLARLINISLLELELAAIIKQGMALKDHLVERPGYFTPFFLEKFLDTAQNNGIKTAFFAMHSDIRKSPWLRNLLFIMLLLKSGYLRYLRSSDEITK